MKTEKSTNATKKAVKYSEAQVKRMKEVYDPEASAEDRDQAVDLLVTELGYPVRSIRSKLVNLGVYVKKATVSKITGEPAAKKDEMAQNLIDVSGLMLNVDSVSKMNKLDIDEIAKEIARLQNEVLIRDQILAFEGIDQEYSYAAMSAEQKLEDQEAAELEACLEAEYQEATDLGA